MKLIKNLYLSQNIIIKPEKIIHRLKKNKLIPGLYVITLPMNNSNMFDIYPQYTLIQKVYKKIELTVVGIAFGREEATELVSRIIMEAYENNQNADAKTYILQMEE